MLEINDLHVEVKGTPVLKGIDLHIKPGETFILFGPNGSGKTTLLMTLMGVSGYEVTRGQIIFKGTDITHAPMYERARLGLGFRFGGRCDMELAARVAEQAASNGVITGVERGIDHLTQTGGNVFALFDHQHAVEDFPLHRTVGAVDDAKAGMPGRYRQGVGFAGVAVDGHRDFIVVGLALAGGQLRGVVEQASGGDHHHHRAGHAPAQGA